MQLLDGKLTSNILKDEISIEVEKLIAKGVKIGSQVIIKSYSHIYSSHIWNICSIWTYARLRPLSKIYVNSKHNTFIKNNCNSIIHQLEKSISQAELISFINLLNSDNNIHGILIQLHLL